MNALSTFVEDNMRRSGIDVSRYKTDLWKIYEALVAMDADEECGLLVSGPVGCGKTTLCDAIAAAGKGWWVRRMTEGEGRGWFAKHGCDIGDVVGKRQGDEWVFLPKNVYLDDIGQEPPLNVYGVRSEPVADFVVELGEAYRRGRWRKRLIATTNLDLPGLRQRYGDRMVDRLSEMCMFLFLRGGSLRRVRGVIGGRT